MSRKFHMIAFKNKAFLGAIEENNVQGFHFQIREKSSVSTFF